MLPSARTGRKERPVLSIGGELRAQPRKALVCRNPRLYRDKEELCQLGYQPSKADLSLERKKTRNQKILGRKGGKKHCGKGNCCYTNN